ncbi:prepilin-type N-terminal cleavage/methylation domain-containing protein [Stenotrophomonas sp. YIM B06876]|uniref:prepilin-type N-terminal cleavage/methylation domain-containing protein n=1 Tax=Stenotrophomonas sp. YIM B06876 TaxID=3060211 RepID=UPI00273A4F41|nr:prepilin-type N-terminal cleavage/methylation domain-containing protein [Stenotrophomonas sp. YIM B06876]
MPRRAAAGFTLIEVLLATVLLAGGLAVAFAAVRSAMAITARGEAMASHAEQVRAVEGLLRRRLAAALPVAMAMAVDAQTGQRDVFIGEEQRLRFVADLPAYLGRGGPYLHDLGIAGTGQARRLELAMTLVQDGRLLAEQPPRAPEALAEALRSVRFRYRGVDPQTGALGDWQPRWNTPGRLPVLVSIEVEPAHGRPWPPLVVALPQYRPAGSGL